VHYNTVLSETLYACMLQEVLNKCFDDIEQFMERLQNVADAYKELEKRRKGRKKKGPQHGGSILSTCCIVEQPVMLTHHNVLGQC